MGFYRLDACSKNDFVLKLQVLDRYDPVHMPQSD
jgi:hypothetical protein